MKRSLILAVAACGLAVQTYGQGTVNFVAANITNFYTMDVVVPGTYFHVALYWLPDQATAPTSAEFETPNTGAHLAYMTNLTGPGGANAGVLRIDGITPAGAPAWFQIRAWENVLGQVDTWEEAIFSTSADGTRCALAGTSNIGRIDTADPTAIPPGTPPNTALTLKGFSITRWDGACFVPEPSVLGLGVLGLGTLLLLRRRG